MKKQKINSKFRLQALNVWTKNTLSREFQECETLRREILALEKKITNEKISCNNPMIR